MFQKKQFIGEYKERIRDLYLEDVDDQAEDNYFNAYIPFQYYQIRKVNKKITHNGIERIVTYHTLETKDSIKFKKGDVIRINNNQEYEVEDVESKIPKQFESLVYMNPNIAHRYEIKILKLNDM